MTVKTRTFVPEAQPERGVRVFDTWEAKATPQDRLNLTDARNAVTALYEAHALGQIRLAVVMLGDRPATEDVVQEAFYGLYRRWHALSDTASAPALSGTW